MRNLKQETIIKLLLQLKPHRYYKGFWQLVSILEIVIDDWEIKSNLSRDVYPFVAQKFNCHPNCIERNIRTLMLDIDMSRLSALSGVYVDEKATVKYFIDALILYIRKVSSASNLVYISHTDKEP